MQAEYKTLYSFLFFVVTTLISITAISNGQVKSSEYSVATVSMNLNGYINRLINRDILPILQKSSYTYLMMASYFSRADVALPGFAKYFRSASDRDLSHINFLMAYMNKRGGYISCSDIEAPETNQWVDGIDALEDTLQMEKNLNKELYQLHKKIVKKGDAHMKHIIEDHFLDHKITLVKELGDHIAVLKVMKGYSAGLGEYMFDKDFQ